MDIRSSDISKLVFKRLTPQNSGSVSLDTRALEVLVEIDGKKNLSAISRETGLDIDDLRIVIFDLFKQKLIALVSNGVQSVKCLGFDFQKILTAQLTLSVGPIAEFLVEDALADLDLTPGKIPLAKAAELIEFVSRDIQQEDKRMAFIKTMLGIIKQVQP